MNTMKRVKLHHLREKIVQDLDVRDIMEHLLLTGAINDEDVQEIYSERVRTDQTRHLLDLLPRKGFEAFDHFVESLRKDYDWLYKEFTEGSSETDSVDEKTFYDAFLLGGVPHPPPYNVVRLKKLTETQMYLRDLKRGHFVVLHGMTGSGKSCLAAAAIDNRNLLMGPFKGSVYWVTLGECDEEELLSHMIQLLQRLEMSSNIHHNNVTVVDKVLINKERAKEELKRCFLEGTLRDGLLILDDVTSNKHLDAFDVGCKIMVTTKDLHVMNNLNSRYNIIKVNDGFTESESLSLLAQSIDVPVIQLPPQAKDIHSLSQGSPMIMALIAGQLEDNEDDAKCSEGRWEYYVKTLSRKNFGHPRRNSFLEQHGLFETISMSINNLHLDKKKYYLDFALFMEDVNIKPEVLQTLWSLETKYEVEDIMAFFTKKSLAVCKWNEQLRSSVYGIHDLLLHYLKEQLSREEKIELHRKLVRSYHNKCKGRWAVLPNDNYVYSYLGYHIYHAEEWQLFQTIFLDLKFIESKLRVTGPADVLGDFRKYRDQIINENKDVVKKLNDFIKFIQVHGLDLYKDQNLDIVQCALLEKKESCVYKEAYNTAKSSREKLYFQFLSDQDLVSHPLALPLREEITSACFTNEIYKILVADGSGIIRLWGLDSLRVFKIFKGHQFKVSHMERHPDNKRFLSCSEDGTLKLWSLDRCTSNERVELNNAGDNLRISSPQSLQHSWRSLFLDDSPKDESLKTFRKHKSAVLSAKFSHSGKEIVSCSKDDCVVWDCESGLPRFTLKMEGDNVATCCTFSWDDSLLFVGDNSKISIYDDKTTDFVASFRNSSSVVAVLCIPFDSNKIIVISVDDIKIWQWDEPEISNPVRKTIVSSQENYSVATFSMGKISHHSFGQKNTSVYVCAASSNDGTYLVTASSDYIISVWNLRTETLIAEHKNYSGFARCLDTYVEDSTPLLLCGTDDQTVKIWRLDQSSTVSSVSLLPHFDSVWVMKDKWLPILATLDSRNRVQILNDNELRETPKEAEEILVCAVSRSGCEVFYGCADGQVKKFSITDSSCEVIMKLEDKVIYLQCPQNSDISLVAAGDSNTLKIWKQDNTVLVCYGQTGPVMQSFLIPNAEQLLACNEDAGVKLWDIKSGNLSQVIIGRPSKAHITSADISEQLDILVLGDANSSFHVASLALLCDFPYINLNSLTTRQIDSHSHGAIRCCQISPQGVLLAIGMHSGAVLIWSLKTLQQLRKLELHSSPVRSIIFTTCGNSNLSPNSVLMVTLGEKIGWWNIMNLISENVSNGNNLQTNINEGQLWEVAAGIAVKQRCSGSMKNLLKKQEEPLLVGCMKLVGSHALKISSSPDSSCFLTVDTSGIIYLLNCCNNLQV